MRKFIVIEHFFPDCKALVYQRFAKSGRMLPDGLLYIDSWLGRDGDRCFQLMETNDMTLFKTWMKKWDDLVSFEVIEIEEKPTAYV